MTWIGRVLLIGGFSIAISATGRAQSTKDDCDLATRGSFSSDIVNGLEIRRGGGGITVTCKARNITLLADSGEMIGGERVDLYGHVRFKEPKKIDLQSDFLTYFVRDERVLVIGHVIATLPSGSTLTGPQATYLRVVPRVRAIEELTAIDSPTVVIAAKGDSAKPITVRAATIFMRGDSMIYASKHVVIDRTDLIARGDSVFLDGRAGSETMRLMFKPSIEGLQGRKFRLEGVVIDAFSKNRKLERVVARGQGHATSQDMEIVADTIDLRMSNDAMERAIAWSHTGQARATSPSQSITADSIDVDMPQQKVRIVRAIRRALAQAEADTVRFRTTEKDWLSGDTVTAWFDTTATKDTSSTPPIKRILATHRLDSARAYYHLAPNDTAIHEPSISYVRGREIRLDFDNRKVALVNVRDSVTGVFLEPRRDSTSAASPKTTSPVKPPPPTATGARKPPPFTRFRRGGL